MYQCIVCEDWFHSIHLNSQLPPDFEEMTCQECIKKYPFLAHYRLKEELVDVESVSDEKATKNDVSTRSAGRNTRKRSSESLGGPSKRTKICKLLPGGTSYDKACFFDGNFRSSLCRCKDCLQLYKKNKIDFLLNDTDTLNHYDQQAQVYRLWL